MKAVHIFPIGAGPDKGSLSYFTNKEVKIGDTVSIAIRGRKVLGIVDKIEDISEDKSSIKKSPFKLKKVEAVLGQTIHGGVLYQTAQALARYYISHPGLTLSAITPAIFSDPALKDIKRSEISTKTFTSPKLIQTSKVDRVIYLKKLIREYFAKKESIAIILPTIAEAKEWRELLSKGIAEHTVFFTGEENKKNQREMVKKSAESDHPLLLIGTFFSAVLPVQKLGAIVVEHESSSFYQTRRRPLIDKRIAIEAFAHIANVPCYFSDSFLNIKTSGRIKLGTAFPIDKINFRIPGKSAEVIDLSIKKPDERGFRALSPAVLKSIKNSLENDEQIFIFAFRKNYASNTVCKDCGQGVLCPNCGHALALVSNTERVFFCTHCNENKSPNIVCSRCKSWNLVPLGIGIDRIKEELIENGFGEYLTRIDGRQTELEMDLSAKNFIERKNRILLGTESAFSKLPEKIDLVVVASLDSFFSMPIYTAPEKAGHILMRIAEFSKRTIVQTRYPQENIMEAIKRGTFAEFAENEALIRSGLGYPPYVRLINLSFSGKQSSIEKATKKLEEIFAEYKPEFFDGLSTSKLATARMQIKLDPELWPLIPKNKAENDNLDNDLFLKLDNLPKVIKIDVE